MVSPRYDVPKAAPEPLRQVQLLINSIDLHNQVEWLGEWLEARELTGKTRRARELREALRAFALSNNGVAVDAAAAADALNRAFRRVAPTVDDSGQLALEGADALDGITAIVVEAMLDGSWGRLKACRNCTWAFYDYSPNRSATWCSMQLCGNRKKTRAYRARLRSA